MANANILMMNDGSRMTQDIHNKLIMQGYSITVTPFTQDDPMTNIQQDITDLIIMDICHSSSLYKETLAETIYNRFDIPVIYLIPSDETEIPDIFTKPACFGFIKLPCTDSDLKAVAEMAIARHRREKLLKDKKRSEQEKKGLEEQLAQAGKMEAVGTLAGGIAHEFNNIIAIIASNSELALDDIHEKDPVFRNLVEINEACIRARDVVRQILTFSRQAGQELKPVKIAPAIQQSIALMKSSLPEGIQVCEHVPLQSEYVNADPVLIHQVIANLCANAVHAMGEQGGILTVSLTGIELTTGMGAPIIGLTPGDYIKLSITDTGHGMDAETRTRIFNPYFTTRETGKGTGMGLSIVHGIIANHGGAITVASEPGMGTTFDVFLPMVKEEPVTVTPMKHIPGGCEKILIVDDDEPIATAVKMVLKRLGYDVEAMTNPIKALDVFRADAGSFDLVITDLAMPLMTGVTFFKHIRNIRQDIPVIMCTGFSDKLSEEKAKAMGINAFMLKPLVRRQLAETVRAVLDQEVDLEFGYGSRIPQAAAQ